MADILTPALGESVTEATIAKWTKKVGDPVRKDELLVELETDKVSLEVVSPADGTLGDIKAAEGDTVVPGTVLGVVSEGASDAPSTAKAPPKAEAAPAAAPAAEVITRETTRADGSRTTVTETATRAPGGGSASSGGSGTARRGGLASTGAGVLGITGIAALLIILGLWMRRRGEEGR